MIDRKSKSFLFYRLGPLEVSDQHVTHGMPVLIGGSAGGRLNLGYHIDYAGLTAERWSRDQRREVIQTAGPARTLLRATTDIN